MKKGLTYLLLSFILMLSGHVSLDAQPCLPDGITFTSQSKIDSFPIMYPNCDTIEGNVTISGQDISNLNGLNNIQAIEGQLRIGSYAVPTNPLLTNLQGLNNLSYIGIRLIVTNNLSLTSLNGLDNLSYIGGMVEIIDNISLTSLNGLDNLSSIEDGLEIYDNQSLSSLGGLDNVSQINGFISVYSNPSLKSLDGLSSLTSVEDIVHITTNDSLINLIGLDSLTMCGGLSISYNQALESLTGLESLTTINDEPFFIWGNENLINLSGLENLTSIASALFVFENTSLESLTGIDNISHESIDGLVLGSNTSLTKCDVQSICEYIADPQGGLDIWNNNVGCNSPQEVEEICTVSIPDKISDTPLSVYPNPFTTSTTIEYELTEPSHVRLTIYNAIGEQVYKAEDRLMSQGKHTFTWSPERLPEGMYYGVLRSEERVSVFKIVKD